MGCHDATSNGKPAEEGARASISTVSKFRKEWWQEMPQNRQCSALETKVRHSIFFEGVYEGKNREKMELTQHPTNARKHGGGLDQTTVNTCKVRQGSERSGTRTSN